MVRHVGLVDHLDDLRVGEHVAHAARGEAVRLRECARDDHVRVLCQQAHCRLTVEFHVRLVDEEGAVDIRGNLLDLFDREGIARRVVRIADDGERRLLFVDRLDELVDVERIVLRIEVDGHARGLSRLGVDLVHRERRLRIDDLSLRAAAKAVEELLDDLRRAAADQHVLALHGEVARDLVAQVIVLLIRIAVERDCPEAVHDALLDERRQAHIALIGVDFDFPGALDDIIRWHVGKAVAIIQHDSLSLLWQIGKPIQSFPII